MKQITAADIVQAESRDIELYVQAPDALEQMADCLPAGALFVGGMTALNMTMPRIMGSYSSTLDVYPFEGFSSRFMQEAVSQVAREHGSSCIVGIGGGSAIDTAKLAAETAGLPVYTVPTEAAQAACTARLAVLYTEEGKRDGSIVLTHPIAGCFADETLLSQQDNRFLCAGIADAFAKPIETYSAELVDQAPGILWKEAYRMGTEMAERLFSLTEDALERRGNAFSQVLYDALLTPSAIAAIGKDRVQFDISHAFYDAMCDEYPLIRNNYLHGEHIAVGNLVSLCLLFPPEMSFDRVYAFQKDVLSQPYNIRGLGADDITVLAQNIEKRRKLEHGGFVASKLRSSLLRCL